MEVRFIARIPGHHGTIGTFKMDAVPRQGEVVSINGIPRTVHEVSWDLNADQTVAIVLLRI